MRNDNIISLINHGRQLMISFFDLLLNAFIVYLEANSKSTNKIPVINYNTTAPDDTIAYLIDKAGNKFSLKDHKLEVIKDQNGSCRCRILGDVTNPGLPGLTLEEAIGNFVMYCKGNIYIQSVTDLTMDNEDDL